MKLKKRFLKFAFPSLVAIITILSLVVFPFTPKTFAAVDNWTRLTDIPFATGWGTGMAWDGGDYIYVTQGKLNGDVGADEFARYSISGNSWTSLSPQVVGQVGTSSSNQLVYPGVGDYIYTYKDDGTNSFLRYSISGDTWSAAAVALWAVGNDGLGLVYPGAGDYLYGFNGTGLDAAKYCFQDTGSGCTPDTWYDAGAGDSGPDMKSEGGSYVDSPDDTDTIFAIEGGNVANSIRLYKYTISTNTWSVAGDLTSAPANVSSGGNMSYDATTDSIVLIHGGSPNVSRYDIDLDSWVSDAAELGGTNNDFGSSSVAANGLVYAAKGQGAGGGVEFYRYTGSTGLGDGTPGDPWQIDTCDELQAMRNDVTASYILIDDVDCSDTVNWINSSGTGFEPITNFTGTFDGQGYTIDSLFIDKTGNDVGLFGKVKMDAGNVVIENVNLTNVDITGSGNEVGSLVGFVDNTGAISSVTVSNAHADGTVTGGASATGGLIGYGFTEMYVSDSSFDGDVVGTNIYTGGLVGFFGSNGPTTCGISNSYSTGSVAGSNSQTGGLVGWSDCDITDSYSTSTVSGTSDVGGLAGRMRDSAGSSPTISGSYATGSVTGSADQVGGLIGWNDGTTIDNAFATGNIQGHVNVGGFSGYNATSTISNVYATGDVTPVGVGSGNVGGLFGYMPNTVSASNSYYAIGTVSASDGFEACLVGTTGGDPVTFTDSFWDTDTCVLGSVGNGTLSSVTGKTTAEMKTFSTFDTAGWDIGYNLADPNSGYPYLSLQVGDSSPLWYIVGTAPTVTDGNISLASATGSGVSGEFIIGDSVIGLWDNSAGGDNNAGITAVTMDFTEFEGGAAVAAEDDGAGGTCDDGGAGDEVYCATYTIVAGSIDNVGNKNISVTANAGGPTTTTADTTNATVDNVAPTINADISIFSDNALDTTLAKAGDTVSLTFTSSEALSSVTVAFSSGGNPVANASIPTDLGGGTSWQVDYVVDPADTDGAVTFTLDYEDLATNSGVQETATDDASSVDVDLTAPTLVRVTTKTQGGNFPATHDSVLWYNYSGDTLEAYVEGGEDLDEVRICVKSLKGVDPQDTCDDVDFANPANYVTSGSGIGATSYTFTGGDDFETIAGQALSDMTGYSMNVLVIDAAGNPYASPDPAEALVMVWNVDPKVLDTDLDNISTTDWTAIDDFTDVVGLTFRAEDIGNLLGEISFPGSVDLTDSATVDALQSFASNVLVGGGDTADGSADVGIDATDLAALDEAADLTIAVPGATGQPGMIVYDDTGTACGAIANDEAGPVLVCGDTISGITWNAGPETLTFSTDGFSSFGADSIAPTVVTYSPADEATSVAVDANLVLTFDENVKVGAGNVVIYKANGDLVETIDITSGQVVFDGATGVTINPIADLLGDRNYYVQIDNTAILDDVDNAYAGIADDTTWSFKTTSADAVSPIQGSGSYYIYRNSAGLGDSATPPFIFTVDIYPGAKNTDTLELQKRLVGEGLLFGPTDGIYGPMTTAAVKAYQKKYGLPETGNVGPLTRAQLNGTPVAPTTPTSLVYDFGPTTLKIGSAGEPVRNLQNFLNSFASASLLVDGLFGPKTDTSVRQWQGGNGLVVDGLVGPKTKALMNSVAGQ